jgi:hypothetical protein
MTERFLAVAKNAQPLPRRDSLQPLTVVQATRVTGRKPWSANEHVQGMKDLARACLQALVSRYYASSFLVQPICNLGDLF